MTGKYPFTKKDNKPVCSGPVNEQKRRDWAKIPEGGQGWMSIEYNSRPKSLSQVKLIWGNMIANTIIQSQDKAIDVSDIMIYLLSQDIPKGVGIDRDFLHQLMYIITPTFDDKGNKVTLSKMNTEQASRLFENYCNIMAGMGIVIHPPELVQEAK